MSTIRTTLVAAALVAAFAANAFGLTYVISDEARRQYEAEYRNLQAERQQAQKQVKHLCGVLSSSQKMFVYNLYGANRWESWTTNQVAARLRQLSGNPAQYRAWWNRLAGQHLQYSVYVRNQELPQLQQRLAKIDQRIQYIANLLASSVSETQNNLTNVTVNKSPVHIRLWDHGSQDGDIVQVFVNGRFHRQVSLTKSGTTLTLPLAFGNHRIEVLAMNEGSSKPNTAAVSITGVVKGQPQQSWSLKTGQRTGMWITVGN